MNSLSRFALVFNRIVNSFVLRMCWGLFFITVFAAGCGQAASRESQPAALPTSTPPAVTTAAATPTINNTAVATPQPTPTTSSETATGYPGAAQPTNAPTPNGSLANWAHQTLVYYDGNGIHRFDLETEVSQLIAPITNQGIARMSHAEPAYHGQEVVYWYVEGTWFIVKVVNTVSGQDRLLLTIDEDDFMAARGSWLGQGRFFELAIWGEDENGVPLVKQWYLFDILSDSIVGSTDDRVGIRTCHILAASPRSGNIATWCSFASQFEEQEDYVVIEANGEIWSTRESGNIVTTTYGIEQQNWSPDGSYVLVPRGSNTSLVNVRDPQIYELFAKDDIYLNLYDAQFSPDGRYLSYEYDVCQFDNFCQRILDLETGIDVWDSSGLFEPPTHFFTWSPDGSYFVLRLGNGDYNIIETQNYSVVKTLTNDALTNAIEIVWQK